MFSLRRFESRCEPCENIMQPFCNPPLFQQKKTPQQTNKKTALPSQPRHTAPYCRSLFGVLTLQSLNAWETLCSVGANVCAFRRA